MKALKFGFSYWKRNIVVAVIIQLISFVAITADLLLPLVSEIFMDYIILDNTPSSNNMFSFILSGKYGRVHTFELFYHVALLFTALFLLRLILIYVKNLTNQHLGLNLETDLRMATFRKLMELDSQTVSEYNTGELLTTINSDTIMFKEMFCRIIPNIFDSIFVLTISVFLLSAINISFIVIPVILFPFLVIALMRFRKQAKVNYGNIRQCNSDMSLSVQENIEAVRLVRSFTNESVEEKKFNINNDNLKNSYIKQIKLSSKFDVIFGTIKQVAYISTIAISAVLVMRGQMLVGYLVATTNYVLKIMDHITQINNMIIQMQQQLVSGNKMYEFMNCKSKIPVDSVISEISETPNIKIENGFMILEGKQVLKNINIDIPFGKKIGIVGGTGSGKSVLLKSLVRIYDLTGGKILVDGKDIRKYSLESLRNQFSYVFQDVFLFSNTIDANIAYAQPDIEKDAVIQAAKHAQAHNFISRLPQGYNTIVGERGLGISGGQKQRVSIARALLKNSPVLVLDDSTSALDVNTERKLLADIKQYYPNKTLLLSAHRLSSVIDCDEIIYMQDGMIVERGTFKELMKLNGHFASIYNIQQEENKAAADYNDIHGGEV